MQEISIIGLKPSSDTLRRATGVQLQYLKYFMKIFCEIFPILASMDCTINFYNLVSLGSTCSPLNSSLFRNINFKNGDI